MTHQQKVVRFIENFIIIWVDSKLERKDIIDDDIHFLNNRIKQEKVFLIVSESLGQQLIPLIEHDTKLDSIYIFCLKKFKHEKWTKQRQHYKIKGIFTDIKNICNQIIENIKNCQHELTSIQTLSSHISKISNHLDASFMYSQLFKEVLLSIEYNNNTFEQAKQEFINFCRIHYVENITELCVIEEF